MLCNTIADVIVSQDKSKWQMAIDSYKEQGLSEGKAFWRAVGDKAVELGYNFLSGAVAGGMMSGGHMALNATQVRQNVQAQKALREYLDKGIREGTLTSEQIQGIVNEGLALGKGTESYSLAQKIQKELSKGETPKGRMLAQLVAQSYTDAEGIQGAKPVSIPQIATNQQAENNPTAGENVPQAAPTGVVGERPAPDLVAPEAMDADGGLVPGAVNLRPEQAEVPYDFNEVYQAVKQAKDSGSLSESRYEQVMETLGFLQNDMSEGNLTEESYQATLAQVMEAVRPGRVQTQNRAEAEALDTNVPEDVWALGQELAKALGRDIIFYRGRPGENGKYADGKIYVNLNSGDPVAQNIAHELTHSIEGTKHYERLKRFVLSELARQNVDLQQRRMDKYDEYKSQGVVLDTDAKIDAELVAEFVQSRLLTDEASIRALVQAEPVVAKRFWDRIRNWGKRLMGSADSRATARVQHMEGLYRRAFRESNKGGFTPGNASVQEGPVGSGQTDSVTEQRRQTEEAFARGELTEEAYDAAMDEFDRAEEERIGRSSEKYSFGSAQKNTTQGSGEVKYSIARTQQMTWDEQVKGALYDGKNIRRNDTLIVAKPSDTVLENVINDVPLAIPLSVLTKASNGKDISHSIKRGKLAQLDVGIKTAPITIVNPERNAIVFVTNITQGGLPVMVSFDMNTMFDGDPVHKATSIHLQVDVRSMLENLPQSATVYVQKNELDSVGATNNLRGLAAKIKFTDRLAYKSEDVKGQFSLSSAKNEPQLLAEFLGQYAQDERPLQGSIVDDEPARQAHRMGYPVIDGVQIIPFQTWVHCTDPYYNSNGEIMRYSDGTMRRHNNYGLVTGLGGHDKLLVSFNNKGAKADGIKPGEILDSKKNDKAVSIEYVKPVRGKYQMTLEEYDALVASEPVDAEDFKLSAEEEAEIQSWYERAGGQAEGESVPIDMDKLPRKAQKYLNRATRRMMGNVRRALGVSALSDSKQIQESVEQLCREYLTEGRIRPETMDEIFQRAYESGIMINREMLDQFQDVRDQLRGTAVTLSDRDKADIADFGDFRKRNAFRLRIVDKGGVPVDTLYISLNEMAPSLFPERIGRSAEKYSFGSAQKNTTQGSGDDELQNTDKMLATANMNDAEISQGKMLANFIDEVSSMIDSAKRSKRKLKIGILSQKHAMQINSIMQNIRPGFSAEGFELWIDGTGASHIELRHGENGKADHTMATHEAKMLIPWASQNADSCSFIIDDNGSLKYSGRYYNSDGTRPPEIRLEKKLDDNTVCVSECVPDTSNRRIWITSAYIKKGSNGQMLNMEEESSPQPTPEASFDGNATTNIVAEPDTTVKDKNNRGQFSLSSAKSEPQPLAEFLGQ